MKKRKPNTPRSKIRACLRQLWLRSRERAAVLKRDKYTCVRCNTKQSKAKGKEAKVQVHHKSNIDAWDMIITEIQKYILESPQETLCEKCHKNVHKSIDAPKGT